MANYYLDFVGLNTFIYEPVGYVQVNSSGDNVFTEDLKFFFERHSYQNSTYNFFFTEGADTLNTFGELTPHFGFGFGADHSKIGVYKNWKFSHDLPNTASFFRLLCFTETAPTATQHGSKSEQGRMPL